MEWKEIDVATRISEIENDSRVSVNVPGKLTDPDILVTGAQQELSKDNDNNRWLFKYEGTRSCSSGLMIKVAPKNINRALRLFNVLIKAFRARGFQFQGSNAILGNHNYEISIREKLIRQDDFKKKPTDILCLKVYSGFPRFEIYDSKNVLIEDKIARIISRVELDIEYYERAWTENAKREQNKKANEDEKAKILTSKKAELDAFKALLRSAQRHHKVKLVRDYINYKEEVAKQNSSYDESLKHWIEWARKKADWYDPNVNTLDSILDEVDKDKID